MRQSTRLQLVMFKTKQLQSQAAICNGFKKSLQSSRKADPSSTTSATRCNFLCNLCGNGDARQVTDRLQRVTYPVCNLYRNFLGLATIAPGKRSSVLLSTTIAWSVLNHWKLQLEIVMCKRLKQLATDFFF